LSIKIGYAGTTQHDHGDRWNYFFHNHSPLND
jgi:hypothetical protein